MAADEERVRFEGLVRNPSVTEEKAALAKQLRQRATPSEQRAWQMLRGRRCLGLKFRRQQVIRGFIVDFYCAGHRLALELDGGVHERQIEQDRERDQALAEFGVRTLRILNEDLEEVVLKARIGETLGLLLIPPAPSPCRERGNRKGLLPSPTPPSLGREKGAGGMRIRSADA